MKVIAMNLTTADLLANAVFFAAMVAGLLLCLLPTSSWLDDWLRLRRKASTASEWWASPSDLFRDHLQ
jgi:hypothetical protein